VKIVHKIVLASVFNIILIALTGFFAYQNVSLVLTKLHFVELADDLNASFLETRLSEKNYFLYGDESSRTDIQERVDNGLRTISERREDIVRATGEKNYEKLKSDLEDYLRTVRESGDEYTVREAGRRVREFSKRVTMLERNKVSDIISHSKRWLTYSLCLILFSAISVSPLIFIEILSSLKKIEKVAHSISQGNFSKVEQELPHDELGSVLKAINSMSDELMNREEQIIQSKKLASIGILTAGVAHELGNPLNNISMLAQAYMEIYEHLSKDERIEFMKKIEEETERIQEIVKNLLDFSKPKKANLKRTDINRVVQKSFRLAQNMIYVSNIEAHLNLQDELPQVFIDEPQIVEVLINLMTNAVQAASPGDKLTIATHLGTEKDCVEVEVSDTGKGIPHELLPSIFDPFFSTKGASGTGLGLSVSYGIIKNHRGNISVKSEVGVGTCFTIELPVHAEEKRSENGRSQDNGH
jgi:two-component system NtrC family sensor kinase